MCGETGAKCIIGKEEMKRTPFLASEKARSVTGP